MQEEFPCTQAEGMEQMAQAMAGRILAGMGTVDYGRMPTEQEVEYAARLAERFAGDDNFEPFASTATYLHAVGLGAAACARNWADQRCPEHCLGQRYYQARIEKR